MEISYKTINGNTPYPKIWEWLEKGQDLALEDTWPTALTIHSWLKKRALSQYKVKDYTSERKFKQFWVEFLSHLLIPIENHKIKLKKAPTIGWLEKFYPQKELFFLSIKQVLGLNGSWQWYQRGIQYPMLPFKLHPYYSVYFPTRIEHLELLDQFLSKGDFKDKIALDAGCGCGVLSFILQQHDLLKIYATDINPFAIQGLEDEIKRLDLKNKIIPKLADALDIETIVDLIVINPPWLRMEPNSLLDKGSYHSENYLEQIFSTVPKKLKATGDLVILFSNLGELLGLTSHNPIEKMAQQYNFNLMTKLTTPRQRLAKKNPYGWWNDILKKEEIQLWHFKFRSSP